MMWRNAGDYVKRWGAALIRGAATNAEFTVAYRGEVFRHLQLWILHKAKVHLHRLTSGALPKAVHRLTSGALPKAVSFYLQSECCLGNTRVVFIRTGKYHPVQ